MKIASVLGIPVNGLDFITVQFGELVLGAEFYVMSSLSVSCIFGLSLNHRSCMGNFPQRQRVDLRDVFVIVDIVVLYLARKRRGTIL
mgnify:CR=1 FL=1